MSTLSDALDEFGYLEWADELIGLEYTDDGNGVVTYRPCAPFYVDGIRYEHREGGPAVTRTMVQVLDDFDCHTSFMFHSCPPTEAELHNYTRTGAFVARRTR